MGNIIYRLLYGTIYTLSLLPFRLLYLISDGIFLFVYYIIRYRRQLVKTNLKSSFPMYDEKRLDQLEKQFYHWFCDYIFETLKLLSISDKQLLKRIEFRGIEQVEQYFDKGKDCAAILGHYCNWEWLSAIGLAFKRHPEAAMGLIYHPLRNRSMDRLFIDIRSAHRGVCVPKKDILRYLIRYQQEKRRSLFGYISDQSPKWENMHLWLDFLNHYTPVFTGGEKLMRKMHNAVFYVDMERPRRGHYICTFQLITSDASQTLEFDITRQFFQMLEKSIHRQPAFYLWTHNRWKRGLNEFKKKYDIINGKIIRKEEYK